MMMMMMTDDDDNDDDDDGDNAVAGKDVYKVKYFVISWCNIWLLAIDK